MVTLGSVPRFLGSKPGVIVLSASALVALWFAAYGGFVFFSDSPTFFHYADQLVHYRVGSYYYTVGYPLIIAISGYPVTGSLRPLLAIQATFAALTPWLAFRTFAPFDRRAAFVAGIVCLASLTPFFFENTFFHDGTCLFFAFLSLTLASIFFATAQSRYIHLSAASATFAYFAQPGAIGFLAGCLCGFGLYGLFDRRQLKHVGAAVGIFAALVVGFSTFQHWALRKEGSPLRAEQLGRRLFFDEYLEGSPYGGFAGPAAEQLKHAIVEFFASPSYPANIPYVRTRLHWGGNYQDLFGQYDGRAADLVDRMFSKPNRIYYETLQIMPDLSNGPPDRLFLHAALAYLYQHPIIVLGFVWRNLVDYAVGPPWQCVGDVVFPACQSPEGTQFYPAILMSPAVVLAPGRMPDKAYRLLTTRQVSPRLAVAASIWQWVYNDLRIPLLASMLLGLIASFWGPRQLRWTMTTVIAVYAANLFVFSLFEEPELRYQVVGISITAFAAGPGLYFLLLWAARAVAPARWRDGIRPIWLRKKVPRYGAS